MESKCRFDAYDTNKVALSEFSLPAVPFSPVSIVPPTLNDHLNLLEPEFYI